MSEKRERPMPDDVRRKLDEYKKSHVGMLDAYIEKRWGKLHQGKAGSGPDPALVTMLEDQATVVDAEGVHRLRVQDGRVVVYEFEEHGTAPWPRRPGPGDEVL